MSYKMHQNIRNCGGKFPESAWAKTGFEIGPIKINQCPKTYITKRSEAMLEAHDSHKHLGVSFFKSIDEMPASFVDLCKIISVERSLIRESIQQIKDLNRKNSNGN